MKKLSLAIAILITAAGATQMAFAQDFSMPIPLPREEVIVTPSQVVEPSQDLDGIVPMAIRSGQPLQMINPLAPAFYGDGRYMVTRDPRNNKPKGFRLFVINF